MVPFVGRGGLDRGGELGMVRRAGFFIDQIRKNLFPCRLIIALRMYSREMGRERGDVMIILLCIIGQRLFAQFPARPREIKWMFQQMLLCDVFVDLIEMCVHKFVLSGVVNKTNVSQKWAGDKLIHGFWQSGL